MTAPTVKAAINDLMDRTLNVGYHLLSERERGLLGDGLDAEEYTGIHSWVEDLTRYTVFLSREVGTFGAPARWTGSRSTTTCSAPTTRRATSPFLSTPVANRAVASFLRCRDHPETGHGCSTPLGSHPVLPGVLGLHVGLFLIVFTASGRPLALR